MRAWILFQYKMLNFYTYDALSLEKKLRIGEIKLRLESLMRAQLSFQKGQETLTGITPIGYTVYQLTTVVFSLHY